MTAIGGPGAPALIVDVGGNPVGVTNGNLNVNAQFSGTVLVASDGPTGAAVPTDASYLGINNGSGILVGVSPSNPIPVSVAQSTPTAASQSAIVTGGTAITIATGPWKGGFVQNPITASDQNIATAENFYINLVTTATANGRGSNICLTPGDSFNLPAVPGGVSLTGIAATTAHAISVEIFV